MQFTTIALSVAGMLLTASATPVASPLPAGFEPITGEEIRARLAAPESALTKRQPGGVYICTGANYSGTCGYAVQPLCSSSSPCNTRSQIDAHCVTLTSPYLRNIGSFGPDQGANVYVSSNGNCHEADGGISYPGSTDFKNYHAGTNDHEGQVITSFLVVAK